MPKGFNEKERQFIKSTLIEKGRALFTVYGLKRTSIEDLTKAAGIAQGSFYAFYNSKEELYFEILEKEQEAIRVELEKENEILKADAKDTIKAILRRSLTLIENNSLVKQLYLDNQMETLIRKLPKEKLTNHINRDTDVLLPFIESWQNTGILIKKDPQIISGIIRMLFFSSMHKNEIGPSVFDETMEFLIDLIAQGLVINK
jgi:Transcriptional regulator